MSFFSWGKNQIVSDGLLPEEREVRRLHALVEKKLVEEKLAILEIRSQKLKEIKKPERMQLHFDSDAGVFYSEPAEAEKAVNAQLEAQKQGHGYKGGTVSFELKRTSGGNFKAQGTFFLFDPIYSDSLKAAFSDAFKEAFKEELKLMDEKTKMLVIE